MWLKIKIWTKVIVATALGLYALLFIYNNTGQKVHFWWWIGRQEEASVFLLAMIAFVAGAIAVILIRTTWKTVRQLRELQRRTRQQRTERELADMKSKAAMLQTRTAPSASAPGVRTGAPAGNGTSAQAGSERSPGASA